jgi:hypothetical protein
LQPTEQMARGYYRTWQNYMRGASWDVLLGEADK